MRRRQPAMIEMSVAQLTVDPHTNLPLVILKDQDGREALPVWVGVLEASAIQSELEQIRLERPLTHDLLRAVIGECGMKVDCVEIVDVRDETYFARVQLQPARRPGRRRAVDARPSDAIALALRAKAPIRVARRVLERAAQPVPPGAPAEAVLGPEQLSDLLASLADDDFGKWKQ